MVSTLIDLHEGGEHIVLVTLDVDACMKFGCLHEIAQDVRECLDHLGICIVPECLHSYGQADRIS